MAMPYATSIKEIDSAKAMLLIDASLQAYNAFDKTMPEKCCSDVVMVPDEYEFVECWTGVDSIFGKHHTVECFGVVFRSLTKPYTYIFAFRGSTSDMDIVDDCGVLRSRFLTHDSAIKVPRDVLVESGFWDIYTT